ncbi:MAG: ATP-dependent Clp protease ATP-binding subunit ClpX [Saprospiraceae bacterium]|jgi:ATP-dependent Clp protease ATP-binding subunit ClpX
MLEGTIVNVPPQGGRKHPEQKLVKMDTQNILFICGGAFDGIEKIIARRINTNVIGYNTASDKIDSEQILSYINHTDLKRFGLIPELIGRLPVLTYLEPLDKETLSRILTEPRNSLVKQYKKLFMLEGIRLSFSEDSIEYIAEKAMEYNLGARGLRSICEAIMTDAMFELPSQKEIEEFKVTREYAADKLNDSKLGMMKRAA